MAIKGCKANICKLTELTVQEILDYLLQKKDLVGA
jgi:hypothetical protein